MKLHCGQLANSVDVVTHASGTTFVYADGSEWSDNRPHDIVRPVRRMFGISGAQFFLGVQFFQKPKRKR